MFCNAIMGKSQNNTDGNNQLNINKTVSNQNFLINNSSEIVQVENLKPLSSEENTRMSLKNMFSGNYTNCTFQTSFGKSNFDNDA